MLWPALALLVTLGLTMSLALRPPPEPASPMQDAKP